jgi:hypothetical protein
MVVIEYTVANSAFIDVDENEIIKAAIKDLQEDNENFNSDKDYIISYIQDNIYTYLDKLYPELLEAIDDFDTFELEENIISKINKYGNSNN